MLISDGSVSQNAQTFDIFITSLPAGGANLRVAKSLLNGNNYNGNSQDLQLGLNSFTVSSVSFDRYVKFQFSSGDITFNSLVHNGNTIDLGGGGCPVSSTQDITIIPSPLVDLGNDVAICQGDSTLLDAGSGHTNYLWNTGETSQTIYADTAGTYSVTVGNGTPASNGNSLSFDGIDDYVDIPNNSVNNLSAGSFMMWLKLNDNSSESIFAKQRHGINTYSRLSIGDKTTGGGGQSSGTPGKIYFHSKNYSTLGSSNGIVSTGVYTHLCVTFDTDSVTFYINGTFSGSTSGDFSIPNDLNADFTRIGSWQWSTNQNLLDGNIYEFSIWNKALSSSEIAQFYTNSPIGSESGIISFYDFDDDNGNSLNNISGSSLNGTIYGASWSNDVPLINYCTATDDVVVTVNPLPTIDLGADTTLICAGTPILMVGHHLHQYG